VEPVPVAPKPDVAIDPVCGMRVVVEGAQHVSEHDGTTYYFCGKGCRLDFEEDPERYLAPDYQPSMGGH
jgi:Cu+-exporting ATPase